MRFYKKAKEAMGLLVKLLVIEFVGEQGIDSGSLRREFFEQALKEGNKRMFAGEDCHRVPRKDTSSEFFFEVFGILVSHSMLQGGPGFPCLSPAVFNYLVSGSSTYCFPTKDDVPLDISTHMLKSFIHKVPIIIYIVHVLMCIYIDIHVWHIVHVQCILCEYIQNVYVYR